MKKKTALYAAWLILILSVSALFWTAEWNPKPHQKMIAAEARTCLGDVYDSSFHEGGPPPEGRGACTDVVYYALLPYLNLQDEVNQDISSHPEIYTISPNPDLDYRWCPTLIIWFRRHWQEVSALPSPSGPWRYQAGDVVFYDHGDGVAGHVGIVSDRLSWDGRPMLIHNPGPVCVEENALHSGRIIGHFRMVTEQ